MSANPDLARGRLNTAQGRKDYNRMWTELTTKLNSVGFGQKPIEKWQKVIILRYLFKKCMEISTILVMD